MSFTVMSVLIESRRLLIWVRSKVVIEINTGMEVIV